MRAADWILLIVVASGNPLDAGTLPQANSFTQPLNRRRPLPELPTARFQLRTDIAPTFTLARLLPAEISRFELAHRRSGNAFHREWIGLDRSLDLRMGYAARFEVAAGTVWMLAIRSPGAQAIRLQLRDFHLPPDGRLFVYASQHEAQRQVYADRGPLRTGDFWTAPIFADQVTLEVFTPAPTTPGFAVEQLAHVYRLPETSDAGPSPCAIDAACRPQTARAGRGVAMLFFHENGGEAHCSGALLSNGSGEPVPFLLTAAHCIADEATANTVAAVWFYRASACGVPPPLLAELPVTRGAFLLAATPLDRSDQALLLLAEDPPPGAVFLGWTTNAPPEGTLLTALHHPYGTHQRFAAGSRTGDFDRDEFPDTLTVYWNEGMAEPGSSGAPLFDPAEQIVGVISRGAEACGSRNGPSLAGSFSAAFATLDHSDETNGDWLQHGLPEDRFYPNDTPENAADLGLQFDQELIIRRDHPDWWRMRLAPGTVLRIVMQAEAPPRDIELQVAISDPLSVVTVPVGQSFEWQNGGRAAEVLLAVAGPERGAFAPYRLTAAAVTPQLTIQRQRAFNLQADMASLYAEVSANVTTEVQYWFEYSLAPEFENAVKTSVMTGIARPDNEIAGVATLRDLASATVYYFRMVALRAGELTYGRTTSFTTQALHRHLFACCALEFGRVNTGSWGLQPIMLARTGNAQVRIESLAVIGDAYAAAQADGTQVALEAAAARCHAELQAQGECTVWIRFSPLAGGAQAGALRIVSDAEEGTLSIPLAGSAPTKDLLRPARTQRGLGNAPPKSPPSALVLHRVARDRRP